ncbi:MAG: hypothetical protein U0136_00365 [Bdellovibrionota bacterium]
MTLRQKLRIWFGVLVVFSLGAVVGSAGTKIYYSRWFFGIINEGPPAVRRVLLHKLDSELHPTAEQSQQIEKIVTEYHLKVIELRRSHQPEMEAILDQAIRDLDPVLNAEQQKKLHSLYDKMQRLSRLPPK